MYGIYKKSPAATYAIGQTFATMAESRNCAAQRLNNPANEAQPGFKSYCRWIGRHKIAVMEGGDRVIYFIRYENKS
jgi:hypothetical protein